MKNKTKCLLYKKMIESKNKSQELISEESGNTSPSPPPRGNNQLAEGGYTMRLPTAPDNYILNNTESKDGMD